MKNIFHKGDIKTFIHKVTAADTATFESGTIHEVYSTFAVGRDAEYCTRFFTLEMIDEDEESIGVSLTIQHIAPALVGNDVEFTGTYEELTGNQLTCSFEARTLNRIIARGTTGQKIIKKEKLQSLFNSLH